MYIYIYTNNPTAPTRKYNQHPAHIYNQNPTHIYNQNPTPPTHKKQSKNLHI